MLQDSSSWSDPLVLLRRGLKIFLLVCVLLGLAGVSWAGEEKIQRMGEMRNGTSMRVEPTLKARVLRKVNRGEKGEVLKENRRWLQLRMDDGTTGWVAKRLVKVTETKVAVAPVILPTPAEESPSKEEPKKEETPPPEPPKLEKPQEKSLAVLDLKTTTLEKAELENVNNSLQSAVKNGVNESVVTQGEFAHMMELAAMGDNAECLDDPSCLMNLADRLQSDRFLGGDVNLVGEKRVATLRLVDVKAASVQDRRMVESADVLQFPKLVAQTALQMLGGKQKKEQGIHLSRSDLGKHPKIAVMDMQAYGVEKDLAENLTDVITTELKLFEGFQVVSRRDIQAMLSFEEVKQSVGCDDEGCFAELGNALGVNYLVSGGVGKIEETYMVSLKVIDIRQAKTVGRDRENFQGPADGLLPAARFVLRRVFGAPFEGPGMLKLALNEEGTQVDLNGKTIGEYPELLIPKELPAGKHTLQATKEGFFPLTQDVYIEPARLTQMQLVLEEEPAKWWQTWWFWTTVGVVVVGGVTTGVVLGTMPADDAPPAQGSATIR